MTTDYDHGEVAAQYKLAKTQPWRARIEDYSFLNLIGDVTGKAVLDVGCGEGHFSRMLRSAGAARVVGFDVSERMIEVARQQEVDVPLGIDYAVQDARTVAPRAEFDVVVSAWLLVHASNREELARLCRGPVSRLRKGGRFVALTTNPGVYDFRPDYRKYGFVLELAAQAFDGAPIDITVLLDNTELVVRNYYLPLEAYTSALGAAGLVDVAVHHPQLAPAPDGTDDTEHWEYLLTHPFFVLLDATKT
ncbi:class I SAM-dependent methyltransferase [Mycobacterium spongiae]|uniref:Methyltransferase domain-containing protein n=1 Tax=Mycobacterium spongiae TaxID=886343 RepID=A0A975PWY9_9MYCO|nr:class I SAM-dependent methyltransferase [Mycobacterium spongiae]QUR67706.1 methyltransferase domain-containing protein [Mycobacterium spongiae]